MNREELLKVAKPILFNTEMVRAILDRRKTATRRRVKWEDIEDELWRASDNLRMRVTGYQRSLNGFYATFDDGCGNYPVRKSQYCPGDILYVRETWNYGYFESDDSELYNNCWFVAIPREKERYVLPECAFIYKANFTEQELGTLGIEHKDGSCRMDWRPSIHMPKEAARIFLEVTGVRVERLQRCGESLCVGIENEGIITPLDPILYISDDEYHNALRRQFILLWDSTIPRKQLDEYGWDANPWVWVIEFERIEPDDERRIV